MRLRIINKETAIIIILILCLFGLYSLGRTRLGHSIPDEKRYIQSTKEMVESGDYITPTYHGKLRFQKPILFYWLIVFSYKIFGIGVFGARFPSIFAALLNVILVYLLAKDLFGKRAGIFSAFILSTSEVYFMYSRFATPDMAFLLFITASIYLFVKAYRGDIGGRFKYIYMYISMGLAMLTKGPLGFLFPMMAVCLFLLLRRDWAVFRELKFPLGLLVFAAVSAPWFIVMAVLHGSEYIDKVWSLEIIKKLKYTPSGANGNFLAHYFYAGLYYTGMTFARHLPWALFLPASLISMPSLRSKRLKMGFGFSLIAAWFFATFISLVLIGSKESYYVLAVSVPVALFLGNYFSRLSEEASLSDSILFKLPFVFGIAACFAAIFLWSGFTAYILDKSLFSFSLLMLAVPLFMLYAYSTGKRALLPVSLFVASVAFFAYFAGAVIPALDQEPLLGISGKIKSVIKPGDVVGVASSAVSYHRLNVSLKDYKIIRADKGTIDKSEAFPGKKEYIEKFLTTKDRRIFCVITKSDYDEYVGEELRNQLLIMDRTFIWKKFHKQDKGYFKRLFTYFLKGKRGLLKQSLKEEIYLLSNKRYLEI